MPALTFQARFVAAILAGTKTGTIRAFRKDGQDPWPGDTLHLYTGTAAGRCCYQIGRARCSAGQG
jgi:uncharacterized protein YqfB (UPF0267 family)